MTPMIEFSIAMLQAVADFLAAEPMIYLFGLVLFCFICESIKTFLS